jgi:hypothetical protein
MNTGVSIWDIFRYFTMVLSIIYFQKSQSLKYLESNMLQLYIRTYVIVITTSEMILIFFSANFSQAIFKENDWSYAFKINRRFFFTLRVLELNTPFKTPLMSSERWASLKFWMKFFCQIACMSVLVHVRNMNKCATRSLVNEWRGCWNLVVVQYWKYELNLKTVGCTCMKGSMYLWGSWRITFKRKINNSMLLNSLE